MSGVVQPAVTSSPLSKSARRLTAWLPAARLVWIALLIIGAIGVHDLGGFGLGGFALTSLVSLPLFAVAIDLMFQRVRFPKVRFPDAAITTGLFLALIFPPNASLVLAGAATLVAISARHVLRFRGRPWFNPAALGALTGGVLLGLAPAWWVAVTPTGEAAMLVLGGVLLARSWRSWRLPLTFFAAYGTLTLVQHLLVGASTAPNVLLLETIDPVVLFFGLFMVVEPRTSPALPFAQPLFAGIVGVSAALLPTVLPSLGIFVALLLGNVLAVVLRRAPAGAPASAEDATSTTRRVAKRRKGPTPIPQRWPLGYRITAGVLTVILIGAVVGASHVTAAPIVQFQAPGGGGASLAGCQSDNPSISPSTLAALHRALGPSVILSFNSATGTVVFYDPVNQVTVTEVNLYEDFGYAEFNGDDYAVSGCAA